VVLAGNALAVHDVEFALSGTSLGIDLQAGAPVEQGHRNHMAAINTINRAGVCGGRGVWRPQVRGHAVRIQRPAPGWRHPQVGRCLRPMDPIDAQERRGSPVRCPPGADAAVDAAASASQHAPVLVRCAWTSTGGRHR
jgi:hypothetical protein